MSQGSVSKKSARLFSIPGIDGLAFGDGKGNFSSAALEAVRLGRLGIGTDPDGTALLKLASLSGLLRANSGIVETISSIDSGSLTPTISFVTPGDLSVSYALQTGAYYKLGPFVLFNFVCQFTPTFTTASGAFILISGIPYATAVQSSIAITENGVLTYPPNITTLNWLILGGGSSLRLRGIGSGGIFDLTTSQFTSGVARDVRGAGIYRTTA